MRPSDPTSVARRVGRRIAELRVKRKLTQEAFAERLEVSVQYVRRVEHAKTNLTVLSLVKVANALSVRVPELFTRPQSMKIRRGRPRKKP